LLGFRVFVAVVQYVFFGNVLALGFFVKTAHERLSKATCTTFFELAFILLFGCYFIDILNRDNIFTKVLKFFLQLLEIVICEDFTCQFMFSCIVKELLDAIFIDLPIIGKVCN
jgi:hypothetical protein